MTKRVGAVFIRSLGAPAEKETHAVDKESGGHNEGEKMAVRRFQNGRQRKIQKIEAAEEGALPHIMGPADGKRQGSQVERQLENQVKKAAKQESQSFAGQERPRNAYDNY